MTDKDDSKNEKFMNSGLEEAEVFINKIRSKARKETNKDVFKAFENPLSITNTTDRADANAELFDLIFLNVGCKTLCRTLCSAYKDNGHNDEYGHL